MEQQRQEGAEDDDRESKREIGVAEEVDEEATPGDLPSDHGRLPAVEDKVACSGEDFGHPGVGKVVIGGQIDDGPDNRDTEERSS